MAPSEYLKQIPLLVFKTGKQSSLLSPHTPRSKLSEQMMNSLLDLHNKHFEKQENRKNYKTSNGVNIAEQLSKQLYRSSFRCLASIMASVTSNSHFKILSAYTTSTSEGIVFCIIHWTARQFCQGIALSSKKIHKKI